MNATRYTKESFVVLGKEGSTEQGSGWIQALWKEANAHFDEIAALAKRDENGVLAGIWGVMSDCSRSFLPWENGFTKGLYLAGAECVPDAQPPVGWVKWVVPGYEYVCIEKQPEVTFSQGLNYLQENGLTLVGAAHDFTCPQTGKDYTLYPIRRLS